MKIFFSGSHSVGKSSLARYTAEHYQLPMIPEVARMILSEQELQLDSLRCDLATANKYQQQVFERQIAEEQKHTAFVADRSIVDTLAYSAQHANILPELLARPELQAQLAILRDPGSILFFVRPSKATLKADGVRESLTFEGVLAIDAQIKLLLQTWGLRYFQISTDSMQERVALINAVMSLTAITTA